MDLKLLPFYSPSADFSQMVLDCGRRTVLFDKILEIADVAACDVPKGFSSYLSTGADGETTYGETTEDYYGRKLKYLLSSHLKNSSVVELTLDHWKNRAIWSMIQVFPDDLPIALMWC